MGNAIMLAHNFYDCDVNTYSFKVSVKFSIRLSTLDITLVIWLSFWQVLVGKAATLA
jgi:hypothetical protein